MDAFECIVVLNPSFIKLLNPWFVGEKSNVEQWSQVILLISSGIDLLYERNPASM